MLTVVYKHPRGIRLEQLGGGASTAVQQHTYVFIAVTRVRVVILLIKQTFAMIRIVEVSKANKTCLSHVLEDWV